MTVYKLSYFELPPFGEAFIKTIFSVSEVCWQRGWGVAHGAAGTRAAHLSPTPSGLKVGTHHLSWHTIRSDPTSRVFQYLGMLLLKHSPHAENIHHNHPRRRPLATPSRLPRHITTKRDSVARFYYITVLNTSRTRGPSILPIIGNNRTPQLLLAYPLPLPVYACTH